MISRASTVTLSVTTARICIIAMLSVLLGFGTRHACIRVVHARSSSTIHNPEWRQRTEKGLLVSCGTWPSCLAANVDMSLVHRGSLGRACTSVLNCSGPDVSDGALTKFHNEHFKTPRR
jgi:hypothetical protein